MKRERWWEQTIDEFPEPKYLQQVSEDRWEHYPLLNTRVKETISVRNLPPKTVGVVNREYIHRRADGIVGIHRDAAIYPDLDTYVRYNKVTEDFVYIVKHQGGHINEFFLDIWLHKGQDSKFYQNSSHSTNKLYIPIREVYFAY